MAKAKMGAVVKYCGHKGTFLADIWEVGEANVVNVGHPVDLSKINRPADGATHHLVDFPVHGFWAPDKGIFVVPKGQVRELNRESLLENSLRALLDALSEDPDGNRTLDCIMEAKNLL